ncbi:MAG: hypothetical protein QW040_02185 [Candidatus Aenigmatarchaeota archaeon]
MKAQIILIEFITVAIALFIAFGAFFPGFAYKNKWREANILINSRDMILTIDRMGKMYEYSFNQKALSDFLNNVSEINLIPWSEIEGTFPNIITIACNCTENQINEMNFWFTNLTINNRRVYFLFQRSNLEEIPNEADVLLIRGYKNLTSYLQNLKNYLRRGVGIVEMMDFDDQEKVDITQQTIFGIKWSGFESGSAEYMIFSKPTSVENITYFPYKYFYHVPLPINISSYQSLVGCDYQPSGKGNFYLNRTNYWFWICNSTSVWFDTNADGVEDTLVNIHETFRIMGMNFTLSYIHGNSSIAISFRPEYNFSDYLSFKRDSGIYIVNITPIDNKEERILLKSIKAGKEFPAVILNSSRVVWMYDLGEGPSDEEKNLLLSLLLWASKKKSTILPSPIKKGFSSSYVNIQNIDMFEVYNFVLGLTYPY